MQSGVERFTLGPLQNPVRGFLHGSAALATAGMAPHLWSQGGAARLALLVFALSQSALYATSSLYHSMPWERRWKRRMQRLDHSMIFVKIAGTLTPIVWLGLDDWRRPLLLGLAWALAAVGVGQKLLRRDVDPRASIPLQVVQAALVLPALAPFAARFPAAALTLVLVGGSFYGVGVLVFVTERPRLWPRFFSHHEVFHVLVVAGSSAHFTLAVQYLARV